MNHLDALFGTKAQAPDAVLAQIKISFHDGLNNFDSGIAKFIAELNSFSDPDEQIANIIVTNHIESDPETRTGYVDIAIPVEILGQSGGISHLLALIFYYAPYNCIDGYSIEALEISLDAAKRLRLPTESENLLRDTQVLLGVVEKPRFKKLPELQKYLEWVFESGFEIFVEDEISVHPNVKTAVNTAIAASGIAEKCNPNAYYILNLTMRPADAMAVARKLKTIPHVGVMVNVVTMGFDILLDLRKLLPTAPIVANVIGRDIICGHGAYFVREKVVCELARLCGADAVYTGPFVDADIQTGKERVNAVRSSLNSPMFAERSLKASKAVISGGLNFQKLRSNQKSYRAGLVALFGTEARRLFKSEASSADIKTAISFTIETFELSDTDFNVKLHDQIKGATKLSDAKIHQIFGTN